MQHIAKKSICWGVIHMFLQFQGNAAWLWYNLYAMTKLKWCDFNEQHLRVLMIKWSKEQRSKSEIYYHWLNN